MWSCVNVALFQIFIQFLAVLVANSGILIISFNFIKSLISSTNTFIIIAPIASVCCMPTEHTLPATPWNWDSVFQCGKALVSLYSSRFSYWWMHFCWWTVVFLSFTGSHRNQEQTADAATDEMILCTNNSYREHFSVEFVVGLEIQQHFLGSRPSCLDSWKFVDVVMYVRSTRSVDTTMPVLFGKKTLSNSRCATCWVCYSPTTLCVFVTPMKCLDVLDYCAQNVPEECSINCNLI